MNKRQIICIIFMSYLLASCTAATSVPKTTATATPISESLDEPTGVAPVEPTAEPTAVIQEDLTPTPDETAANNTPEVKREVLSQTLPAYLMSGNYQVLEALMGDPFVIGYWRSEGQMLAPAEAVEQLRLNLLPDPTAFRFTNDRSLFPDLGEVDSTKAFGPKVKVVDLVYSAGWGADGQGEAILAIGLNLDGQYWPGMIYAPTGFEEVTETNDGAQQGLTTYVNEHAGYAFDYPAGWILTGEPHPNAYNYAITIRSFKLGRGTGPVPVDQAKLDFVTCNSAECNTLQAVQARIDEQVAAGTLEILSEETWMLAGGIPAIRRQVIGEMGVEVASLITEIDGQALQVSGYGDLAAFDEIVRTLRPAQIQPPETEPRAVLEIRHSLPIGEAVKVQFFLINNTDSGLYVLNWFTPLEGIGGDIFRVKRDGEVVPYQGILASRSDPTPDAYTMLEAGEVVSAEVDLSTAYDFSIPGNYEIEFISPRISHIARTEAEMATKLDELGPIQISANRVTVKIGEDMNVAAATPADSEERITPEVIAEAANELLVYENPEHGFTLMYPPTWTVAEVNDEAFVAPGSRSVQLSQGTVKLVIGYRRTGEETMIMGSGAPAGEFESRGSIHFVDQDVGRHVIVFEGKDKAVFYGQPGTLIAAGGLEFAPRLDDFAQVDYQDIELPQSVQGEADMILGSLAIIEVEGEI